MGDDDIGCRDLSVYIPGICPLRFVWSSMLTQMAVLELVHIERVLFCIKSTLVTFTCRFNNLAQSLNIYVQIVVV